jgi:transmembrane 9 superfamily member 2/4
VEVFIADGMFTSIVVALVSCLLSADASFYLPGVAPYSYEQFEDVSIFQTQCWQLSLFIKLQVKLFVTKLTSTKTQIPYDYYSLPFCKPKHEKEESENLGEMLSGDKIENSVYKVTILNIISID